MFFISKKKFEDIVAEIVENKINNQIDRQNKDNQEYLSKLFDDWVEKSLKEVDWSAGLGFMLLPGKIEVSLSNMIQKVLSKWWDSLKEINSWTNKEEFIDKVIERINKKQIGK